MPTQGSNPGLPHCRQILYQLSHQGSPRILEWVAYPFSRGSFQPRNLTGGLLHCRRILNQLSYQRSPDKNQPYGLQAHKAMICLKDTEIFFKFLLLTGPQNDALEAYVRVTRHRNFTSKVSVATLTVTKQILLLGSLILRAS